MYRYRFAQTTQKIGNMMHSAWATGKHLWQITRTAQAPKDFIKGCLAFAVFIVCLSACLLLLVDMRTEGYRLGYQVVTLQKEKQELEERLLSLKAEQARLRSHQSLLQMNKAMGLYLLPLQECLKK